METANPPSDDRAGPSQGDAVPAEVDTRVYVDREEFCRLLLSRGTYKRVDDRHGDLTCLVDVTSGRRYAIQRERLFREA